LCPCDEFIKNKKCICGMYKKLKENNKYVWLFRFKTNRKIKRISTL
jgi:hypothetical protein